MATTLDAGFDKAFDEASKEQSSEETKDQATTETPGKEAEAATGEAASPAEEKDTELAQPPEGSDELLPSGEWEKLKDPDAKLKALNKAWTQKTQKLAEDRKQFTEQQEALEPFTDLVKGLQENPLETVKALANHFKIQLGEAESKAEVKEAANELLADLKQSLGPDLEFLADKLAPVFERTVAKLASQAITKEVGPLKKQAQAMQEETVRQQIDANLGAFTKKYPDWKKHEAKMTEIGVRLQPAADPKTGKPPTWMDYMEDLYYLATKDGREGDIAKQTVERMKKAAEKTETTEGGVSQNRVTKSAPKEGTWSDKFNQAFEDAKAGIVYE